MSQVCNACGNRYCLQDGCELMASDAKVIRVCVDDHETRSGIVFELEELGAEAEVRRLEVGDYAVSNRLVIERKTVDDFHKSIFDEPNHLYGQLADLKRCYERPLLLIEGDPEDLYLSRMVYPNSIRGILCSIAVDMQVPITYTRSVADTAGFLVTAAKREQLDHQKSLTSLHGKRSHMTLPEQQVYVVSAIPGVGPATAMALLKHFGSVHAVITASIDELCEVRDVGVKTARRIHEVTR